MKKNIYAIMCWPPLKNDLLYKANLTDLGLT